MQIDLIFAEGKNNMNHLNYQGLIIGIAAFLIIGIFHPIVIKAEYYFGKKIWPAFLVSGIIMILISLMLKNTISSVLFGILGFSSLWSIHEVIEQEERVRKGWFPVNPNKVQNKN